MAVQLRGSHRRSMHIVIVKRKGWRRRRRRGGEGSFGCCIVAMNFLAIFCHLSPSFETCWELEVRSDENGRRVSAFMRARARANDTARIALTEPKCEASQRYRRRCLNIANTRGSSRTIIENSGNRERCFSHRYSPYEQPKCATRRTATAESSGR